MGLYACGRTLFPTSHTDNTSVDQHPNLEKNDLQSHNISFVIKVAAMGCMVSRINMTLCNLMIFYNVLFGNFVSILSC